jgi:DNA-binding transcriptional LysR family regulator
MPIVWDDIHIFQTAVRTGGYGSAGRKLGVDRTTIGRRFARLETAIGQPLWELSASGSRPTSAGLAILRAAETMERAMVRLASDIAAPGVALAGPVRLAGTAGLANLMMPGLGPFLDQHPDVSIEIVSDSEAIAAVHKRMADIGIAIARGKPRDLAGEKVRRFQQRLYASKVGRPDREIGWSHATMLANPHGWARLNMPSCGAAVEVDGMEAMRNAVRAGLGRAWLWEALGEGDATIQSLPDALPPLATADIWIVRRADIAADPVVTALCAALTSLLDAYGSQQGS